MSERERVGCPKCGSLALSVAQIVFEDTQFFSDGTFEYIEAIDYGGAFQIYCGDCGWTMGKLPNGAIDPHDFFRKHQEMIREEFLKVMKE